MAQQDLTDTASLASQDKVLIEKDGHFELVKASDVQANDSHLQDNEPLPETTNNNTTVQGEILVDQNKGALVQPENNEIVTNKDDNSQLVNTVEVTSISPIIDTTQPVIETNKDTKEANNNNNNNIDIAKSLSSRSPPPFTASSTTTDAVRGSSSAPAVKSSNSSELITRRTSISQENTTSSSNRKPSRLSSQDNVRYYTSRDTISRLTSAHSSNGTATDRIQLNERAFQVWIERKNAELLAKRKRDKNRVLSIESEEEKLSRNQKAFDSWVRNKQRLILAQRALEKAEEERLQNKTMSEEEKRDKQKEMFRMWLRRKNTEKVRDVEMEEERQKELNEIARTKDTDIAQKAYKKWLRKKAIEAKEEAERQRQCRKLFFKESRELHRVLTNRFQGF